MRLIFTFADKSDLAALRKDDIYTTTFDVPDEAIHLIGVKERIFAIGELVASFSQCSVFLSCRDLAIELHPLKQVNREFSLHWERKIFALVFRRPAIPSTSLLKILAPVYVLPSRLHYFSRHKRRDDKSILKNLHNMGWYRDETGEQHIYLQNIEALSQQLLVLLNSAPKTSDLEYWFYAGFHPSWRDSTVNATQDRRTEKLEKERKQKEREEIKRLKREETIKARSEKTTESPQHGAGRRPGARPGIYKGISMRSQLEIRFAAELDERNIRWFYESEAVGDAGYLVDFYLPDLGVWVEVKGTIIAKDRQVLPDVARYLKQTRQHRLMMYMQTKAYVINPSGFREIESRKFWDELVK